LGKAAPKKAKGKSSKMKKASSSSVKSEPGSEKPPNYTPEDDLWLFIAYVNISTDPRKRANQKGAQFWEHVARQCAAIREADLLEMEKDEKDDDDPVVWVERNGDSVMNRFQRTIQRQVNKFN
jgi:hypothetical protein